jgi:aldose 1-epimerase
MFKVSLEEKKGLKFYQVTDTQTEEYVTILHEAGCALNNYVIMKKGIPIDLIDGYQDFNDLQENIDRFFKGHFLFPFPNRIYGGSYTFNGKKLQLKKNFPHEDNAIHGFLYNKEFSVLSFTESSNEGRVSFSREISGEFEGYPFKCKVLISFIVGRRKLNISTEIINTGEIEILQD